MTSNTCRSDLYTSVPAPTPALAAALEILEFGDFQERWEITKQFPQIGTEAIAYLVRLLETDRADIDLCWFIARILGKYDRPEAISASIDLLTTTENEEVKAMAATTLANLGQPAIKPLCRLFGQPQWRAIAVEALAQMREPKVIETLLQAAEDDNPQVRSTAVSALIQFRDPRIPPILVKALEDLSSQVRREATIGLGLRSDLLGELDLVGLLKKRLYDFELSVCQQATIALSRCNTDSAAFALFQVLQSPPTPEPLKLEIVRSLAWMGSLLAIEYLRQGLQLKSVPVCQAIVSGLGQVEDSRMKRVCASILINWLNSKHPALEDADIRLKVALELGRLGNKQALRPLLKLQNDTNDRVRVHARAAYEKLTASSY
ncbi:MAG: HEAT repeat domain-containing protein [Cyanobacteriota bacterium]|nr:HEAT repeat domain-containing protein [Cyanobacteriota bacterium]